MVFKIKDFCVEVIKVINNVETMLVVDVEIKSEIRNPFTCISALINQD